MVFRQRDFHFYFINEVAHFLFLWWMAHQPLDIPVLSRYPFWLRFFVIYLSFFLLNYVLIILVIVVRRQYRPSAKEVLKTRVPRYPLPNFHSFIHLTRDGVQLKVQISEKLHPKVKKKVMVLAAPLGQCGPSIYNPIMSWYGSEYIYLTWDYRGFFGASSPDHPRQLAIPEHARDGIEILTACGFDHADVLVGHSMGTAVALETCLLFPKRVKSLILMNGFHGQVFQTAFQPLFRVPFAGDFVGGLVEFLLAYPRILEIYRKLSAPILSSIIPIWCIYARTFGSPLLTTLGGESYMLDFLNGYMGTIFESKRHTEAWLRLFQELDAHSVFHLLHTIKQPTLIISGALDAITPPMQSVQISRRIPHSIHYCDPFSTHASIMESPEWCLAEIEQFVRFEIPQHYEREKRRN